MAPHQINPRTFRGILNETPYDAVYLNSFFSPRFTIVPLALRRLRLVPRRPLVLAPRGELSAGALSIKRRKKWAFIQLARAAGLYGETLWQASSAHEEAEIRNIFGPKASVQIAPNLRGHLAGEDLGETACRKAAGSLSVAFLSRISRKKNLDGALRMLAHQQGRIDFHIYGPHEDANYWHSCLGLIETMPPNIRVCDHGTVDPGTVVSVFRRHHLFLLPTLGENFGFAILESLSAGCPVLISDRTPWRGLEAKGVGWDLPLEPSSAFERVLQQCVKMDNDAFQQLSRAAARFGR
ncbi:MAG: glycosyltransferase, partial [Thermoguttaceae bacterium]